MQEVKSYRVLYDTGMSFPTGNENIDPVQQPRWIRTWYGSYQYEILIRCHVTEYRTTRENWDDFVRE